MFGSSYTQARYEGVIAGRADASLDRRSEYSWHSFSTEPEYVRAYSEGYRVGWIEYHRNPSSH